jgi:hypothetical protein
MMFLLAMDANSQLTQHWNAIAITRQLTTVLLPGGAAG